MEVVGGGGGERAPSYGEGVGSETFGDLLGQNFSLSHHETCISFFGRGMPPKPPFSYNFRLFSLQLKDIHKITTPRLQRKKIRN